MRKLLENLLCTNIYNILNKNSYNFSKERDKKSIGTDLHFANLLNGWFNRRQLDSQACFCIQSAGKMC